MLYVLDVYAAKWRCSFNQKKSQVVVVGRPTAKKKAEQFRWMLSGKVLELVGEYKYLGVETGKSVGLGRWNTLLQRLYRQAKSALSLLVYRAGGSGGLNATLIQMWVAEGRPLLEYGCQLWGGMISKDWERKLESVQSQFGRATLGLHGTPAAVGVRMELALSSLRSRRRRLKLGLWDKFCRADPTRLLSLIFRRRHREVCMGGGPSSQLHAFKEILQESSLKDCWRDRSSAVDRVGWSKVADRAASWVSLREELEEVQASSSLQVYSSLELKPVRVPQYLDDYNNVEGTRLLSKCRLGHLRLLGSVARDMSWPLLRAQCLLCRSGEVENVQHFLSCPGLRRCQQAFEQVCRRNLTQIGGPALSLLSGVLGSGRLRLLLGGSPVWPSCPDDQDAEDYRVQCGQARWALDKATKNFLVASWRLRESVLGVLSVRRQRFYREPSTLSTSALLRKQPSKTPLQLAPFRRFWQNWVPVDKKKWRKSGKKKRANFYVVFEGRQPGVYYKWSDCSRAIGVHDEAVFRGFRTQKDAEDAYSSYLSPAVCLD